VDLPVPMDRIARVIDVTPLDSESGERGEWHARRRRGVVKRRQYYNGTQYLDENAETAKELEVEDPGFSRRWQRLPEHYRLHAYSRHVKESVDFLADQITGKIAVRADDPLVKVWTDRVFRRSRLTYRKQELAREILIAGDLFVNVVVARKADQSEPQVVFHLWEAETVEADYDPEDWTRLVEVRTEERRFFDEGDEVVEKRVVQRWRMEPTVLPDQPDDVVECWKITEVDGEEVAREPLGLPFIPWVHMHGESLNLRSMYGKSIISFSVMETVDRYNAVRQLEFQALRYNSFGTLVVVGDEEYLRSKQAGDAGAYTVHKDIADVLVFPGGTEAKDLSLAIDVEAFRSQVDELRDELYGLMGLERIDADRFKAFGNVSGYALEILNRKTDGLFRRVSENLRDGIVDLIQMGLVVDAYARGPVDEVTGTIRFVDVNPDDVWPNRDVTVDFGTAYIVDEVAVRDDFVAGLISLREALRRKGYDDAQIDRIATEIEAEASERDASLIKNIRQQSRLAPLQ